MLFYFPLKSCRREAGLSFLYNTRESVSKKPFSPQLSCNSVTFTHYVRPGELRGRSGRFSARSCTVFILFIFSFHAEPKVVSSPREGNNEAHSVTDDRARYLLKKKKRGEREKKSYRKHWTCLPLLEDSCLSTFFKRVFCSLFRSGLSD